MRITVAGIWSFLTTVLEINTMNLFSTCYSMSRYLGITLWRCRLWKLTKATLAASPHFWRPEETEKNTVTEDLCTAVNKHRNQRLKMSSGTKKHILPTKKIWYRYALYYKTTEGDENTFFIPKKRSFQLDYPLSMINRAKNYSTAFQSTQSLIVYFPITSLAAKLLQKYLAHVGEYLCIL